MEENRTLPVGRSEAAASSSAHSGINVPLNLSNWRDLPEDIVEDLTWFHQYVLNEDLNWKKAEEALGYDASTIFRVLKGTYDGSWANVAKAIRSFRKLVVQRGTVQRGVFVKTPVSEMIFWALGYIMAKGGAGLIVGESGMGKTIAVKQWCSDNNHGRSVLVECLPVGGAKGVLRQIAAKVGVNKNLNTNQMLESVIRAFNENRILVLDEVHELLPSDDRSRPVALDLIRRIHDISGCALCLISTERFDNDIKRQRYMFEQIIGRTGKPFVLPNDFTEQDVRPIVTQFIARPTAKFLSVMVGFANDRDIGRLRYVVETLQFASKIAHDTRKPLTEEIVYAAHSLRERQSDPRKLQAISTTTTVDTERRAA